ncbi:MAG: FAD:protein FMN transferase, partial [candidate division WOR-3 bacterium]
MNRALIAVVLLLGCSGRPVLEKQTRLLMDTYVTVSVLAPRARARQGIEAVFRRLEELEQKFNHLDSTSPLYAFNTAGEPVTDSEIVLVVKRAVQVSELSGGLFDITVEPLVRLWGFYDGRYQIPPTAAIESCRALVGWRRLIVEDNSLSRQNPLVTVDLGGVAKGYALAEAAEILRDLKLDSGLVDIGGDIYALGRRQGRKWRIGIREPRGSGIIGVIEVSDKAVVTSGDYERFFIGEDSVRYSHIIDPRTGAPAPGVMSVTVVHDDP